MSIEFPIILKKPKGRKYIVFIPEPDMNDADDPDWFVRVSWRKNNNHVETDYCTILKKEVKQWLNQYTREKQGYVIQEDFDIAILKETELLP